MTLTTLFAVFSNALREISPEQTSFSRVTFKVCKFHVN